MSTETPVQRTRRLHRVNHARLHAAYLAAAHPADELHPVVPPPSEQCCHFEADGIDGRTLAPIAAKPATVWTPDKWDQRD